MHDFLKSVGFSELSKSQLNNMLMDVIENATYVDHTITVDGVELIEMKKEYAENMGVAVCGTYNEDGNFSMEYYYPYFVGSGITTREKLEVQKLSNKEAYEAICDDINIGVTLIYYMQNICEYMSATRNKNISSMNIASTLCGLSIDGKIILPVEKNSRQAENIKKKSTERNNLIAAARAGDEEAIESLTLEDLDIYSNLSRRIVREDILSIVETTFMPYGVESDQYSIIGEIENYYYTNNNVTNEKIYVMTVNTNGLSYDICINEKNLLGQPEIGRRFKGTIWMQGIIKFGE